MEKSCFLAEGESSKLSEGFLVEGVTLLDISQLVRPLYYYALSVSTSLENFVSLIVRRRTNRGSTVLYFDA